MRAGLFVLLCVAVVSASTLERFKSEFPSWRYVLWEFDLPEDFIATPRFLRFASKHRRRLQRLYKYVERRESYLLKLIRSELLQEDMSDLFVYMSIVESALRCDAVSSKKATGVWQFMPATAKRYRLHCDSVWDERRDPVASTRAATEYLRHLHDRFNKWYLAVMAYNCGEGCVQKAIRRSGTQDAEVLLDASKRYVPKETREYLLKVVLLAMIAEDTHVRVLDDPVKTEPFVVPKPSPKPKTCSGMTLSVHKVRRGETIETIAKQYGTDAATLFCLNPTIKSPDKGSMLIVPYPQR